VKSLVGVLPGTADSGTVTPGIDRLIRLLDDDSTDTSEDAKFTLMSIGPEVVEPLAAAVGSLGPVAQLCAIEVFDHFDDAAAVPALIGLLGGPDQTVRTWSMESVAALGAQEALPALRAAHRRLHAAGLRGGRRAAAGPVGDRGVDRPWRGVSTTHDRAQPLISRPSSGCPAPCRRAGSRGT
jgi:hypothetical protein